MTLRNDDVIVTSLKNTVFGSVSGRKGTDCTVFARKNAKLQHNKSPPDLISVATLPYELDNGHVLQIAKS